MSGSRNIGQFYLVLSLFYGLKRGSIGFIAVHYFPGAWGGGCPTFSGGGGGVQMLISIETHKRTSYFPGGSVWTPYPPLDPHMGNVIITGQYLSQSGL